MLFHNTDRFRSYLHKIIHSFMPPMRKVNVAGRKNSIVCCMWENLRHNHPHIAGHTSQQFFSTCFLVLVMHSLNKWFIMSSRPFLSYRDNDNENMISMKWSRAKYLAWNKNLKSWSMSYSDTWIQMQLCCLSSAVRKHHFTADWQTKDC